MPTDPPIAIDETIRTALRPETIVAFSMSGGKDSGAAALAVTRHLDSIGHPTSNRIAIHADLGSIEWPQTPQFVASTADQLRLPLTVVRRPQGGLIHRWNDRFERALQRYANLETFHLIGPWSSPSLRFCTADTKVQPISRELKRRFPGKTVISVIGIRRQESSARAKAPVSKLAPTTRKGPRIVDWNPIIDWTTDDVFASHARARLPLHDAYSRFSLTRLSCAYCIMQSRADTLRSAQSGCNSQSLDRLVKLELRSTFPFQPSRWLSDETLGSHPYTPDAIALAKQARQRRLQLETQLPTDLRYQKGWPPRIPTTDEARAILAARTEILAQHGLHSAYRTVSTVRDRFAELHARQRA